MDRNQTSYEQELSAGILRMSKVEEILSKYMLTSYQRQIFVYFHRNLIS